MGLIADPAMAVYVGGRGSADSSVGGLFFGNPHQLPVVTAYSGRTTVAILKLIGVCVPLRMTDRELEIGDRILFNEEVFEPHHPIPPPEPIEAPVQSGARAGEGPPEPALGQATGGLRGWRAGPLTAGPQPPPPWRWPTQVGRGNAVVGGPVRFRLRRGQRIRSGPW